MVQLERLAVQAVLVLGIDGLAVTHEAVSRLANWFDRSFNCANVKLRNVPCLIKDPPLRDIPTREMESETSSRTCPCSRST